MEITIAIVALIWVSGGLMYINAAMRIAPNDDTDAMVVGLRRAEPAAIVALILFLTIWPFVFVAVQVSKLRGND